MDERKDCVFCKIVRGEIPSFKVYEDDAYFGFLDIFPKAKGHSVLIPKKHYRWVLDVPDFEAYFGAARKLALATEKVVSPEYMSFQTFGVMVPHAHIHILPFYSKSEDFLPRTNLDKEAGASLAKKILTETTR